MSYREHPVFKFLTRPIIALVLIAGGFMLLFPTWGPRDLSLYVRLPSEVCASDLTVSAFSGEHLARRTTIPIRGQTDFQSTHSMPREAYRVTAELGCRDGRTAVVSEERVDLHEHAELSFDLSRKCPCHE